MKLKNIFIFLALLYLYVDAKRRALKLLIVLHMFHDIFTERIQMLEVAAAGGLGSRRVDGLA